MSATELIGRTVTTEIEAGNFRGAWYMIQLNVGQNNFSDYIILDSKGIPVISDTQSQNNVLALWNNLSEAKKFNNYTYVKRLSKVGDFISEFRYNNRGNSTDSYSLVLLFEDTKIAKAQWQITIYIFGYVLLLISFIGYLLLFSRAKFLKAIDKVNGGTGATSLGDSQSALGIKLGGPLIGNVPVCVWPSKSDSLGHLKMRVIYPAPNALV